MHSVIIFNLFNNQRCWVSKKKISEVRKVYINTKKEILSDLSEEGQIALTAAGKVSRSMESLPSKCEDLRFEPQVKMPGTVMQVCDSSSEEGETNRLLGPELD